MSFILTQQAIDVEANLCASEKSVLIALCRFANDDGRECYPSTAMLSAKTGINTRTVMKTIKSLVDGGWISYRQEPGKRREFLINVEKLGQPLKEVTGVQEATGVQEVTVPPCKKLQEPPVKSYRRKKHIKEHIKKHTYIQHSDHANENEQFVLEADKPVEPKRKALIHKFELETLPEEWSEYCKQVRPDIDAKKAFVDFRFYFTQGQGAEKRRSDKGWNQAWQGWVRRQREEIRKPTNKTTYAKQFDESYYKNAVNPDGTFNWGI